jgi:hydrogenase maturation protease
VTEEGATRILVIGYGNTLRRDDGAGCLAADLVRGWSRPGVRSFSVTQLTPELALDLSSSRLAIFVDARTDSRSTGVRVETVNPLDEGSFSLLHGITPRSLSSLVMAAFGRSPPCWMVSIPAEDFSLGEGLSEVALRGVRDSLTAIEGLIDSQEGSEPDRTRVCPLVAPVPLLQPLQHQDLNLERQDHPG